MRELASTGQYRGRTLGGTLEETHISWIILSRKFAFKIKKPLRLSFLDFASLAKRKKYCDREVALNRRFSDIYLGVLPIRRGEGHWRLGRGKARIVDYAVQMKRMDSAKRMDLLLGLRRVSGRQIHSLARAIASFHEKAAIVSGPFERVEQQQAFNDIRTIKAFTRRALGKRFDSIIARAMTWNKTFLRHHEKRLCERVLLGYKRDLHGDLHSGNIFLYQKPVIFDCIEFSDAFRHIDVLDEIAFFCMDLEAHAHKQLSELFLNEYAARFTCFETNEDRNIFLYYKCYRANVRAKVHALAAKQADDRDAYKRHIRLLKDYVLLIDQYIRK